MALSLLFLGCPTEAESSSETVSYEKTALWAAVVAAETDLNSAFVSNLGGNDVAQAEKWVTRAQHTAFKGAIEEARTFAYTLPRAAAPTPAEEPAIAKLTTARTTFDGQKQGGGAEVVSTLVKDFTGNQIITGTVTAPSPFALGSDAVLTVGPGGKLITVSGNFDVITGTQLIIKEGGTFEIASGTTTTATSGFVGKIIVESGATVIDKDGTLLPTGTDSDVSYYEINAGATVIVKDKVLIGPSSGTRKGEIVQLTSGTMKIVSDGGYVLDGSATVVGEYLIPTAALKITGTSILTVAAGGNLRHNTDADFLSTSDSGARIVLSDAKSYLTVLNSSAFVYPGTPPTLSVTGGINWTYDNDSAPTGYSGKVLLSGPVTLVYSSGALAKQQ
jgi:hypothetical protein